jgi:RimJ/RimL family protein N-acetyltransferase
MGVRLESERLVLRPWQQDEAEFLAEISNDQELIYLSSDLPEPYRQISLQEAMDRIERYALESEESDALHLAICLKETDEPVGYFSAAFIDEWNRSCQVGMTILAPAHRGRGYGKEALSAAIRYLFGERGLNRIQCELYDFNRAARRLVESLGFVKEGTHRQAVWKRGAFVDEHVFALLRTDFQG